MLTTVGLAADALRAFLVDDLKHTFGTQETHHAEVIGSVAQISLECIGNSDALYHNLEHTMLVTLCGRDIMRGRALKHHTKASDWTHFVVACLMHDIGYVRGILRGDRAPDFVVAESGETLRLPRGASDAALAPYHVDRSKMFIRERIGGSRLLDADRIADAVEATRFPAGGDSGADRGSEGALVRAADLIGQLGDPLYLRKANALYWEFEELGTNKQLGYSSPADLVDKYPEFFWRQISPSLTEAIEYLNVTVSGRQWLANLQANVFCAEHAFRAVGPVR